MPVSTPRFCLGISYFLVNYRILKLSKSMGAYAPLALYLKEALGMIIIILSIKVSCILGLIPPFSLFSASSALSQDELQFP